MSELEQDFLTYMRTYMSMLHDLSDEEHEKFCKDIIEAYNYDFNQHIDLDFGYKYFLENG